MFFNNDIESNLNFVKANFALEGMDLTDEEIENCRRILCGEITADELVKQVLADKGYFKNEKQNT